MVEATEEWRRDDARSRRRSGRGQVVFAVRGLHQEAPVRPPMVVGEIACEDVLKVALVVDDHVVEAISAEGADHAFAESVRGRGSGRGCEEARAESAHAVGG
jgi:hypothetical protein